MRLVAQRVIAVFLACFARHSNLIVGSLEIQFGEVFATSNISNEVLNMRHWISIWERQIVQLPIVSDHTPGTVLLFHQMYWGLPI
uniref:Uncharacterized protein n=1 Tax=Lepeophtheirus salmonis TaxID=72036 RepID=A0A0K2UK95_LEPSM